MPSPAALRRVQLPLSLVIAALLLLQAVLAGRSEVLFGSWDIEVHGMVGNGLFVLVVANLAIAVLRRATTAELTVAAALGMLTFAQVGLGYVGREQLEAAAWHVPNGVLLMGLGAYQIALLQARPAPAR